MARKIPPRRRRSALQSSSRPDQHVSPSTPPPAPPRAVHHPTILPHLLTSDEVADLLRTSRKAIYAAVSRGQIPGVVRLQRRVLFDRAELLSWLTKRHALSLEGNQR